MPSSRLAALLATIQTAACLKKSGTSSGGSGSPDNSMSLRPWYGQLPGSERYAWSKAYLNSEFLQGRMDSN